VCPRLPSPPFIFTHVRSYCRISPFMSVSLSGAPNRDASYCNGCYAYVCTSVCAHEWMCMRHMHRHRSALVLRDVHSNLCAIHPPCHKNPSGFSSELPRSMWKTLGVCASCIFFLYVWCVRRAAAQRITRCIPYHITAPYCTKPDCAVFPPPPRAFYIIFVVLSVSTNPTPPKNSPSLPMFSH
jgi:hypothetical protein